MMMARFMMGASRLTPMGRPESGREHRAGYRARYRWHQSDRHVERRADDQRAENADRHVALRIDSLLRRGRNRIEANIGLESNTKCND
jgi:hypothetical protein